MDEVLTVLPQTLEIVEIPLFVAENVDYYVGVVQNSPASLAHAFGAAGREPVFLFELFFKKFRKGFYLRFGGPAANYKVIADGSFVLDGKIYDALCLS